MNAQTRLLQLSCARILAVGASVIAACTAQAQVQDFSKLDKHLATIAAAVPSALLAQRSQVVASAVATMVNGNEVAGNIGEALARDAQLLGIAKANTVQNVATRQIRQGIDNLLLQLDSNGFPQGQLIAVEAKFHRSMPKLGKTETGIQGSQRWLKPRLGKEAKFYAAFGNAAKVQTGFEGARPAKAVDIKLSPNSKNWIYADGDTYITNASESNLAAIQQRARATGAFISQKILTAQVQSYVMWIQPDGSDYKVSIFEYDERVASGASRKLSSHILRSESTLGGSTNSFTKAALNGLALEIARKNPALDRVTCQQLASQVLEQGLESGDLVQETVRMQRMQQWRALGYSAGIGASIPILLAGSDVLLNWFQGAEIDWGRTSALGGAGIAGAIAGTASGVIFTSLAIESPLIARPLSSVAARVGVPPLSLFRTAGGFVGGGVASVVASLVMVASGYSDWDQFGTDVVIGVAATGVAMASEAAVLAAVMTYASASTGTAISSLGGAAATNAALAWLGGGAVSAGGLGVWGGAVVLGGGAVVIAVVATYAIVSVYEVYKTSASVDDWKEFLAEFRGQEERYLKDSPSWYRATIGTPLPSSLGVN